MPYVLLDPATFVIDESVSDKKTLLRAMKRIINWSRVRNKHEWIKICIPKKTVGILSKSGLYPLAATIRSALDSIPGPKPFAPNDIDAAISFLIERCFFMEETLSIKDAAFDIKSCDIFLRYPNGPLRDAAEYVAAILALSKVHDAEKVKLHRLSLSCLASGEYSVNLDVSADLTDPEGAGVSGKWHSVELFTAINLDSLISSMDPHSLWGMGLYDLAINIRIIELCKDSGGIYSIDRLPKYKLGHGFVASLDACQASRASEYSRVVLEACARLLAGIPKYEVRDYCYGTGKSEKQVLRTSDNSLAYRMHITKSPPALRLMLWKLEDGSIELANIGNKDELDILR